MIQIDVYKDIDYSALEYRLPDGQAMFTSHISDCLASGVLNNAYKTLLTIRFHHSIVGFFILDQGNDKFVLTDNQYAIVIRSFSINPIYQGKGIGQQAMMAVSHYVQNNFTDVNEIVLSVNSKNINAYHTYLKAGFVDTGECIDRPIGVQNVLSQILN